jgi:rubrerythrin
LTEPESLLAKALAKQREDAIKAQKSTEGEKESGSILIAYKCPVCMDTPEDATSTACGHLFCHRCIIEYLNSADQTLDSSKQARGTCPICRKPITKVDVSGPKRSLIPLALKLTTKKRSLLTASKA